MKYGLDTAFAPSLTAAKQMFRNGYRVFGGYIGGPRATHAWANGDWQRMTVAGFELFIPYYVGANAPWDAVSRLTWDDGFNAGLDAAGLAGNGGFNSEQPLALDAEYGTWQAGGQAFTDYCDGWCAALHDIGHSTILYSDPRTIAAIGSHFDQVIAADYVTNVNYQTPPFGQFDPSSPPPWDGWQFDDQGRIAGVSVDLCSFKDDFNFASYTPPN